MRGTVVWNLAPAEAWLVSWLWVAPAKRPHGSGLGEMGSHRRDSSALCNVVWAAQGLLGILGRPRGSFWFSPTLSNLQSRQHEGSHPKPDRSPCTPPSCPPRAFVSRAPTQGAVPAHRPVQGPRLSLDSSAFHSNSSHQVCVINI